MYDLRLSETKLERPEGIERKIEIEGRKLMVTKVPGTGDSRTGVEGGLGTPVTTGMRPTTLKKPPMLTSSQEARADSR